MGRTRLIWLALPAFFLANGGMMDLFWRLTWRLPDDPWTISAWLASVAPALSWILRMAYLDLSLPLPAAIGSLALLAGATVLAIWIAVRCQAALLLCLLDGSRSMRRAWREGRGAAWRLLVIHFSGALAQGLWATLFLVLAQSFARQNTWTDVWVFFLLILGYLPLCLGTGGLAILVGFESVRAKRPLGMVTADLLTRLRMHPKRLLATYTLLLWSGIAAVVVALAAVACLRVLDTGITLWLAAGEHLLALRIWYFFAGALVVAAVAGLVGASNLRIHQAWARTWSDLS